jgi:ADP-heptose:LPS heptosyltransferase
VPTWAVDRLERIVICQPTARLGGLLRLTPLLDELDARLPAAEVDVIAAHPDAARLFATFPNVARVYGPPPHAVRAWAARPLELPPMRAAVYDLAIDPCPRSRAARAALGLVDARLRLGFTGPGTLPGVDLPVPLAGAPAHVARRAVYLVRRGVLGATAAEALAPVRPARLRLTECERAVARQRRRELLGPDLGRPLVAFSTGGRGGRAAWWLALVARLRRRLPDAEFLQVLATAAESPLPGVVALPPGDPRRVAAVIGVADAFVAPESGLLDLGAASGVPVVGLYAATDPAASAPLGARTRVVRAGPALARRTVREVERLLERSDPRVPRAVGAPLEVARPIGD